MVRTTAVALAASAAAAAAVAAASAVFAQPLSSATAPTAKTLSVDDAHVKGNGCINAPARLTVDRNGDDVSSATVKIRIGNSNKPPVELTPAAAMSTTLAGSYQACITKPRQLGRYVAGPVTLHYDDPDTAMSDTTTDHVSTSFEVKQATFTRLHLSAEGHKVKAVGRVRLYDVKRRDTFNAVGAPVTLQVRRRDRWVTLRHGRTTHQAVVVFETKRTRDRYRLVTSSSAINWGSTSKAKRL